MAKVKKKAVPAKRETKGKQHALRSASLDRIADYVEQSNKESGNFMVGTLVVSAFRKEASYLRSILR